MNPLRAILVEDEPSGMENLRWKLENHCPEIEIVAECLNGTEAIQSIRRLLPDLLFLDIMLGDMSGFDVLEAIKYPSFDVIFTTSYDDYAIKAIKNSALDYLVKPVQVDELQEAVAKARIKQQQAVPVRQVAPPTQQLNRFGFPIATGQQFIDVQEVVYVKADDNVAVLHLKNKNTQVRLTKTLGWVEEQLEEFGFCRVHHSYLINLNHLTEYIRNEGGYVIMSDGKAISVSRRRKDNFLQKLETLK